MDEKLIAVLCWLVRYEVSFGAIDYAVAYIAASPELATSLLESPLGEAVRDVVARLQSDQPNDQSEHPEPEENDDD